MLENDIQCWLENIKHDTETVKLILRENGYPDIGIYHIHQATEKLLKVLFILNKKSFPKIHFLDKLSQHLIESYPNLKAAIKDILLIDQYLPKLRYPNRTHQSGTMLGKLSTN